MGLQTKRRLRLIVKLIVESRNIRILSAFFGVLIAILPFGSIIAQEAGAAILITNVNVFDGKGHQLVEGISVLVEGNMITNIAKSIPTPD